MRLPTQSEPVQRSILGQRGPGNSVGQTATSPDGVQPSAISEDFINALTKVWQNGGPLPFLPV